MKPIPRLKPPLVVYEPVPLIHFTLARTFRETGDKFHWSIVAKEVEAELEWLKSVEVN